MTEITIILSAYFILMTAIGVHSFFKAKTTSDFYVSGRKGSWWQISGSLFATIMGGSAILGTVELAQQAGWAALWFLGSASAGLAILAMIAPRVRQLGRFTLPEMISLFYGRKAERVASVMIPAAWLGIIAVQIIAGAKILSSVHLMTYHQGAFVSSGIFILYTLLGGQKSILKTDFVQAVIILTVLIILVALKVQSFPEGIQPEWIPVSVMNDHFRPADLVILLLTYSVTFMVGPDIYSRIFCSGSDQTARKSVILVAVLIIIAAYLLTFLGQTMSPDIRTAPGETLILPGDSFLPPWAIGLLAVMMLSAIMSSADTTLLTASMILSELVTGDLENRKSIILTRIFIVSTGLLALLIASYVTSILGALLLSLSFFSGAFIIPVLAGIKGWKVNRERAFAAMIAGGLTALTGKILQQFFHLNGGYLVIIAAYLMNGLILFSPGLHLSLFPQNRKTK